MFASRKLSRQTSQSGNIFVYILGSIFLLGILIVLLRGSFQEGSGIDAENMTLKVSEVQRYASELERAVNYILSNHYSETDIRFAHDDALPAYGTPGDTPGRQVFEPTGGGAEYKLPPKGVNDGTHWQFYATTHIKDMGTDTAGVRKAELLAVLPNVTQSFCEHVNMVVQEDIDLTADTDAGSDCVYEPGSEFAGTYLSGGGTNILDDTKFSKLPAKEACVKCAAGGFHYYRVLISR